MLLHEIITRLQSCDPKTEGCSFSVRDASSEQWSQKLPSGLELIGGTRYLVRVLFKGNDLKELENYCLRVLGSFSDQIESSNTAQMGEYPKCNFIFPTHDGGGYKISCNLSILT